ncbi:MAG TPA: GAF domain-containing protein [Eubacteriales bacterium]|nr:GAF domain-containing protein [Eubacteriales bacterium]
MNNEYELLYQQLISMVEDERHFMPNISNTCALIYGGMKDLNWCGFYFIIDGELVLSSFQGKPACVRIPLGKGVCGTAASQNKTFIVEDVHKFSGHIACDCESKSEIVVPIRYNGKVIGVFDVDSPIYGRFSAYEKEFFENICDLLQKSCDFDNFE